jgi:CBS domain-containing protein
MKLTIGGLIDLEREVWSISPDASVYQALERLASHDIGAIIVVEDDKLIGIMSERDYARKVELADRSSHETLVRDIMTANPQTVTSNESVDACMAIMTEGGFRHLPVVDEDGLKGVVSIVDVVRTIVENQASLIGDLERYISG